MMKSRVWILAASLVASLCLAAVGLAQEPAKPATPATTATPPKGEAVLSSVEVTAAVTKLDLKTREVTLKTQEGKEYSFVADPAVKNLDQMKVGDVVTVAYKEALAFEVNKSPKELTVAQSVGGKTAEPGEKPAAAVGQKLTATVAITAIDPKVPSVTFKGPAGNTRTVKVQHPEKLEGVKVGDTVDITYTEAVAVKVDKAPAKK